MGLEKLKKVINKILLYVLALAMGIITFFPFYWAIVTSLKNVDGIFEMPPRLIPKNITLDNYIYAIKQSQLFRFALNSIFVTVVTAVITIMISICATYAITRFNFKGKKVFYSFLASTQVFPMVVVIIPLYMFFRALKLYNTYTSLIGTYVAIATPIAIVMLLGYFKDMPKELEEAAKIDGCNRFQVLMKIIIPVVRPAIITTAIYIFITIWQEYLIAVSLIGDKTKFTLTVGLSTFKGEHTTNWGSLMATSVIMAIPGIILFLCIQNYFIDSLAGSVKE